MPQDCCEIGETAPACEVSETDRDCEPGEMPPVPCRFGILVIARELGGTGCGDKKPGDAACQARGAACGILPVGSGRAAGCSAGMEEE
jgi:hypothetical protein